MSLYLRFAEIDTPKKTKEWQVLSVSSGDELGRIKWYAPWRQYCFFPAFDTIWNKDCLGLVQTFINSRMAER